MKEECKKLEGVGRKIAMKCKGLPLAAKSMGSMLSFRNSLREWEDVLESPLWKLEEVAEEVFRVLNLSYSDLSPEMVDKVYLKGLQYFGNLVMRSFFQDVQQYGDDESKMTFKIHDIVHDFAISLSKTEYCFILDGKHSSHQTYDNLSFDDIGKVRSFSARYVSQDILTPYLFKSLKRVRLLRLVDCDLKELPQEIGELIHLRYLELRGIPIQELPETLCNLHNLQTLHLECCGKLRALPQGIHKLINLRHLLIGVEVFPQGLSKLTSLWTLKHFRAGRGSNKLGYLQNLNHFEDLHLTLEDMDEDDDLVEAEKAELTNKIHILELNLFILGNVRMDVMDVLQLPPNLHTLQLDYYKCNRFPKWITSFNYLRELSINKCRNCSSLPLLGILPMLEELSVYHMEIGMGWQ
ncbi:putative disease resistance protein RGA1 [Sesamum angolense]|uniref:Disease resistance protein RGA1 n=1 Tax=Sesamum angolense TaxID=2727404 RepID=A0AAE2C676_9LAMI|nr:putative disease resistance protein RGA1 [Sesamum angolense]